MNGGIRILLVDDHSLFRESLSRLLQTEPDFKIMGGYSNASSALSMEGLDQIDVALLDYDLGEEQGSRFLRDAPSHGFQGRILLVTAGANEEAVLRSLRSGASGVFLKHSAPNHLMEAIRKVAAGETWLDPGVIRTVGGAASGGAAQTGERKLQAQTLTGREQTVLKGVLEGFTNKEIASQLDISESAVKAVLQQLFDKTGVRSRSQLVRIALEKHSGDWL